MHLSEAVFINLDSYGIDHSGFSLRDELEYQTARQAREQALKKIFQQPGNYPQYGAGFWGRPENNYGFGYSDISRNIGERPFTPFPATLDVNEQQAGEEETRLCASKKPFYAAPTPARPSYGDIFLEGAKGFGEGIENGLLAFFNARTSNAYDLLNYKYMEDDYAKRQEKMQRQAENAGLGWENKLANQMIDWGGQSQLYSKLLSKLLK